MNIETRQHDLFNVDLGEGVPRRALIAAIVMYLIWWTVLVVLIGSPNKHTAVLFVAPPALLTFFGWQETERNPQRRHITEWALTLRWLAKGHRPVIALGRVSGRGHERTLLERLGSRLGGGDPMSLLLPWRMNDPDSNPRRHARMTATGRPARLGGRVQMIGLDHAEAQMQRRARRGRRKAEMS